MIKNRKTEDHSSKQFSSVYRVCIAGTLPGSWKDRLGNLQVVFERENGVSGQTLLTGAVTDQAELLGILNTLHELRIPLLLVEAVDMDLHTPKNQYNDK